MARLLKPNQKSISLTKKTITDPIYHLQPVVMILNKTLDNWLSIFAVINQYQVQVFYNRFENIEKALSSNKFFYHLGIVIQQYKSRQILVIIQALDNSIADRLYTICRGILSDSYYYQVINNFVKLINQKSAKNILIIIVPILIVLHIYIRPTRFLELNGAPNAKIDMDKKLCKRLTGLNWNDGAKIEEAIAMEDDNKNEENNLQKKNKRLKRENQCKK